MAPDRKKNRVAELEAELAAARADRDDALAALAKERELTNALRLQLRRGDEAAVPRYPPGAGLGPPALRYELADRVNETVKRTLGPVHSAAKRLLRRGSKKA